MLDTDCHTRQSNNASEHGDDNDDDDDDDDADDDDDDDDDDDSWFYAICPLNDSLLLTSISGGWPDGLEKDIPPVPYIDKLRGTLLNVFVWVCEWN